jgi:hypothetical protein
MGSAQDANPDTVRGHPPARSSRPCATDVPLPRILAAERTETGNGIAFPHSRQAPGTGGLLPESQYPEGPPLRRRRTAPGPEPPRQSALRHRRIARARAALAVRPRADGSAGNALGNNWEVQHRWRIDGRWSSRPPGQGAENLEGRPRSSLAVGVPSVLMPPGSTSGCSAPSARPPGLGSGALRSGQCCLAGTAVPKPGTAA